MLIARQVGKFWPQLPINDKTLAGEDRLWGSHIALRLLCQGEIVVPELSSISMERRYEIRVISQEFFRARCNASVTDGQPHVMPALPKAPDRPGLNAINLVAAQKLFGIF
jgi:hypothetical protein